MGKASTACYSSLAIEEHIKSNHQEGTRQKIPSEFSFSVGGAVGHFGQVFSKSQH